ncbi:hypothetical protein D3C76_1659530 [compost metagenome]|jgi:hypothetical protein
MSKTKSRTPPSPTSIEILGSRLQRIINSPAAQKAQAATLSKMPNESLEDWNQIIDAITETDGVYVALLDDGSVRVSWDVPDKD